MILNKSSRHSKITGDFAEDLILYWLSKYGFECASVDHTGIDIIAKNPQTKEFLGISVKGRSRNAGKEGEYLRIPKDNFPKAEAACESFGCIPYFAIVIDQGETIYAFILSMEHLLKIHPIAQTSSGWKMTEKWLSQYIKDPKIKSFKFTYKTLSWW